MEDKYLDECYTVYGYTSWGWKGIGLIYYDKEDVAIWFRDDAEIMTEDEIIFNDLLRLCILESML